MIYLRMSYTYALKLGNYAIYFCFYLFHKSLTVQKDGRILPVPTNSGPLGWKKSFLCR